MAGRIFKTVSVTILGTLALSACRKVYPPQPAEGGAVCPQPDIHWSSLAQSAWPMYRHDPQHTGRSSRAGPREGRIVWTFSPQGAVQSAITIAADGTICFGVVLEGERHSTALYAVDPSGRLKWRTPLPLLAPESQPVILADGRVAIAGEELYLVGPDGQLVRSIGLGTHISPFLNVGRDGVLYLVVDGDLVAVHPDDGVVWRISYGEYFDVLNPAMGLDGETLYVFAKIAPGRYVLCAIDARAGTLRWRYPAAADSGLTIGAFPPVVDVNGNVYFAVGHDAPPFETRVYGLYAVDRQGRLLWRYTGAAPLAQPALNAAGALVFYRNLYPSRRRVLTSLDCQGDLRWEVDTSTHLFNPVCDVHGVLYFCSEQGVYAYGQEGQMLWSVPFQGRVTRVSPPALGKDGLLYVGTFAPPDGSRLYAIK